MRVSTVAEAMEIWRDVQTGALTSDAGGGLGPTRLGRRSPVEDDAPIQVAEWVALTEGYGAAFAHLRIVWISEKAVRGRDLSAVHDFEERLAARLPFETEPPQGPICEADTSPARGAETVASAAASEARDARRQAEKNAREQRRTLGSLPLLRWRGRFDRHNAA